MGTSSSSRITVMFSVILLVCLAGAESSSLLSRGRPAYQSDVGVGGVPERAVNGDRNGLYCMKSCTHTKEHWPGTKTNNWWMVDLGRVARVDTVKLYNRNGLDCLIYLVPGCEHRINGASVYVDDHLCGTLNNGLSSFTVSCGGATGRWVRVLQDRDILTLCEVEVYGTLTSDPGSLSKYPILLSRNRPTTGAPGAVDGNYDKTCVEVVGNTWSVTLAGERTVDEVKIYSALRTGDRSSARNSIQGVGVFVGDVQCGQVPYSYQELYKVSCNGLKGTQVRLVKPGSGNMVFCEVEVFGRSGGAGPTPECEDADSLCPLKARQGECGNEAVLALCPLSCRQCVCGDVLRACQLSDCAANGALCRQTCGRCECEDLSEQCESQAELGRCVTEPALLTQCPLSCNTCQCGDNSPQCTALAEGGKCYTDSHFMLTHCAEACSQCGEGCRDLPPFTEHCVTAAAQGKCADPAQQPFMRVNCAKSCDLCEEEEEEEEECADNEDYQHTCPSLAALGMCTDPQQQLFMAQNCRRSCGLCEEECADTEQYSAVCPALVSSGLCRDPSQVAFTKQHCKKSCGFCEDGSDSSDDEDDNPAPWGAKSCDLCEEEEECADSEEYQHLCPALVAQDRCTDPQQQPFMRVNCAKSCDLCEEEEEEECADTEQYSAVCPALVTAGLCRDPSQVAFTKQHCKKSCGFCEDGSDSSDDEDDNPAPWGDEEEDFTM